MPIPPHIAFLRERIGHITLLTPAAAAIIRDERAGALIRRGDGRGWSLPGGIMEPGERIVDCLVREAWEETGLEVEPIRLVGIYSDPAFTHVTFPTETRLICERDVRVPHSGRQATRRWRGVTGGCLLSS